MSVATEPARECAWYSKMTEYLRCYRNRNRINPQSIDLPDCEFYKVEPDRMIRVLRPQLKSGRYYEPRKSSDRPESINDNFYTRWTKRPHPSGNCRCSFRQSVNSSRLSSHEEQIITQEINRIRTSLCEAEKSGTDIEELEKSLVVDLSQLEAPTLEETKEEHECERIENIEEDTKKRIVRDLDRYISDLLDEILDDTIKAIAKTDNPFDREKKTENPTEIISKQTPTFDISFTFHGNEKRNDSQITDKGYVNRGFVGSASDPDALDFHLRHNDPLLEHTDCIDSGINSVETVELQPENEQRDLEQSLIDIIDAKLGGSSIGKSLEDLGMEIDATDEIENPKIQEKESSMSEATKDHIIPERQEPVEVQKSTIEEKTLTPIKETPVAPIVPERSSKSLDDVIEEPAFNSLRLEFKRSSTSSSITTTPTTTTAPPLKSSELEGTKPSSTVTSKVNKTVSVIRQRLATRLSKPKRKSTTKSNKSKKNKRKGKKKSNDGNNIGSTRSSARAALELEDYRRRFPVPDSTRCGQIHDLSIEEVTLRNRKPTLIFLHGFGSSADCFEPQLKYFSELGYPCLAPDLLGHGFSTASNKSKDYKFERLLADLEAVLTHYAFKPGQKCVLVAHNYGCSFATALAHKFVGNVHQLVLISGGGPTPLAPPASEGPGHCCLRASLAPLLFCGMHRAILYSARGRQHPYCGGEIYEDQWPSHMRHVLRGMSWPEGDYVFHRRILTPTLLVHGLRDNKVSLVQECQMERTMIKAFLEAIPAAGHIPMNDCPEQLNHMIHCFIDLWKNKKW